MVGNLALGLGFPLNGGAGGGVKDQNANFGANTAASAGGWQPVKGNGYYVGLSSIDDQTAAANTWAISSNRLVCTTIVSALNDDDGVELVVTTTEGAQITITLTMSGNDSNGRNLALAADCRTKEEFKTAWSTLVTNDVANQTVRLRPSASFDFTGHADFTSVFHSHTNKIRIESEDHNNPGTFNYFAVGGGTGAVNPGRVALYYTNFYHAEADAFRPDGIVHLGCSVGYKTEHVDFYGCDFSSDFGKARDGWSHYDATNDTLVLLSSWSNVNLGDSADNITVQNCKFHNCMFGLDVGGTNWTITNNEFYYMYADCIHLGPHNDIACNNITISGNLFRDWIGNGGYHMDCIQVYDSNGTGVANIQNLTLRANVVWPGYEGVRAFSQHDATARIEVAGPTYSAGAAEDGDALFVASGTVTLGDSATLGASWDMQIRNDTSASSPTTITVDLTTGGNTINGASTLTLPYYGQTYNITNDGAGAFSAAVKGPNIQGFFMPDQFNGGDFVNLVVEGNLVIANGGHGVTIGSTPNEALVRQNTIGHCWPGDTNGDGSSNQPDDGFADANVKLWWRSSGPDATASYAGNVAEEIAIDVGTPVGDNNITTLSRSDETTYTDVFQGTAFVPTENMTKTDILALYRPKIGGSLLSGSTFAFGDVGCLGVTTSDDPYDFETGLAASVMDAHWIWDVSIAATSDTTIDLDWKGTMTSGTFYYVLTSSATVPTSAQIKAGQDHTGSTSGVLSGNVTPTTRGTQTTINVSSAVAETTYYPHAILVTDSTDSNIDSGSSVTTPAAGGVTVTLVDEDSGADNTGFTYTKAMDWTTALSTGDRMCIVIGDYNIGNLAGDNTTNVTLDGNACTEIGQGYFYDSAVTMNIAVYDITESALGGVSSGNLVWDRVLGTKQGWFVKMFKIEDASGIGVELTQTGTAGSSISLGGTAVSGDGLISASASNCTAGHSVSWSGGTVTKSGSDLSGDTSLIMSAAIASDVGAGSKTITSTPSGTVEEIVGITVRYPS